MTFDGVIRDTGNTKASWVIKKKVSSDGIGDNMWKVSDRELLMSEDEIRLIIDPDLLSWCCLERRRLGIKHAVS